MTASSDAAMQPPGRFRFVDTAGVERALTGVPELAAAIHEARLDESTLLFDAYSGLEAPAGKHDAYRSASLMPPTASAEGKLAWGRIGLLTTLGGLLGFYREAVVTSGPQQELARLIGYAMGAGFGVFAIAALFFAWTRGARRLIPAAMTVILIAQFVSLLTHPPRPHREELRDEVNRFAMQAQSILGSDTVSRTTLDHLTSDPAGTKPSRLTSAPTRGTFSSLPDSRRARAMRAMSLGLEWSRAAIRDAEQSYGFAIDSTPAGWLESPYLANASRFPEVATYLEHYDAYLQFVADTAPILLERAMRAAADTTQFSASEADEFVAGARQGYEERSGPHSPAFRASREFIQAALRLHDYLLRIDPRVTYDAEGQQALFDVDSEREEAVRLEAVVRAKAQYIVTLEEEALQKMKERVDSLVTAGQ